MVEVYLLLFNFSHLKKALLIILLVNLLHSKHAIGFMIWIVLFFISSSGMVITATSQSMHDHVTMGIIKISETKIQKPPLSPYGSKLAYVFENNRFILNLLTKNIKQITTKQFEWPIYPIKNHKVSGGKTRLQLFTKMTNLIKEKL